MLESSIKYFVAVDEKFRRTSSPRLYSSRQRERILRYQDCIVPTRKGGRKTVCSISASDRSFLGQFLALFATAGNFLLFFSPAGSKAAARCLLRRNPRVGPLRPSLPRRNDQRGGFEARSGVRAGCCRRRCVFICSFHRFHLRLKVYRASRLPFYPSLPRFFPLPRPGTSGEKGGGKGAENFLFPTAE